MLTRKNLFFCIVLMGMYGIVTYLYFSAKPFSRDYCPITMPDKQPLILEEPNYRGHTFKSINDVSCLNETRVYDIIVVKNKEDIRQAIKLAREKNIPISIAGVRHSMGGQAFFNDSLVLDMTSFNRIISLEEENKVLKVESGATWHQIQSYLHEKNLAVKAMQSTDIFTVGGSLSVNAHGMDHTVGSMASTIKSFTIMLADGSVQKVTHALNPELFNAVIGGYGLFGVVLEVELEVTDNVMYQCDTIFLKYQQFPDFFERESQEKTYSLL